MLVFICCRSDKEGNINSGRERIFFVVNAEFFLNNTIHIRPAFSTVSVFLFSTKFRNIVCIEIALRKECRTSGCHYKSSLSTVYYNNVYALSNRYFATSSLMFQAKSRYSISYEPFSRFFSPLTSTAHSYLLLILFCRPGLRNHRNSPVVTCGGT